MHRLPAEHVPSITRQLTLKDDAHCDQKAAFLTAQGGRRVILVDAD
jgi:hypothetical protein